MRFAYPWSGGAVPAPAFESRWNDLAHKYVGVIETGFIRGETPEQSALVVLTALLAHRVTELPAGERDLVRSQLRHHATRLTHPVARHIETVAFHALGWEDKGKISRNEIDVFLSGVFQHIPHQNRQAHAISLTSNFDTVPGDGWYYRTTPVLKRRA
jgi:hypothetical protein